MPLFFRVLDFCWTWLYAAVRLPFVVIGWLLGFAMGCFIRWYDAVAFIVGMPTFWERQEFAKEIKAVELELMGILADVRHLEVLNKALTKIGHTHAEKIKTLEAELAAERQKFADLEAEYEKRFA